MMAQLAVAQPGLRSMMARLRVLILAAGVRYCSWGGVSTTSAYFADVGRFEIATKIWTYVTMRPASRHNQRRSATRRWPHLWIVLLCCVSQLVGG